jgi:hypothetical protein
MNNAAKIFVGVHVALTTVIVVGYLVAMVGKR